MVCEVMVTEIVRAMDVYLIKFQCPVCGQEQLTGSTPTDCDHCRQDFKRLILDVSRAGRRVIAVDANSKRRRYISKRTIQELHRLQSGQCAYCDCTLQNYHVDHIRPFWAGGSNNISNLALACAPCNQTAGGKVFQDFYAKREYVERKRGRFGPAT